MAAVSSFDVVRFYHAVGVQILIAIYIMSFDRQSSTTAGLGSVRDGSASNRCLAALRINFGKTVTPAAALVID